VAVGRRESGQQRLVPQRDADAVATRRSRGLQHHCRSRLARSDAPQELGRHVLVEPNL